MTEKPKKSKFYIGLIILIILVIGIVHMAEWDLSFKWSKLINAIPDQASITDLKAVEIELTARQLISIIDELKDVKIYLNDVEIEQGLKLLDLLVGFKEYHLKAVYKGHVITKDFEFVKSYDWTNEDEKIVALMQPVDPSFEANRDIDGDGITDNDERDLYKTNPYNADTDGDGYSDTNEIIFNLNPLEVDDINIKRTYNIELEAVSLLNTGYGNFTNLFLSPYNNKHLTQNDFSIGEIYKILFSSKFEDSQKPNTISSSIIRFKILDSESVEELGIYFYDEYDNKIEWMTSKINAEGNYLEASLYKSGIYGMGNINRLPDIANPEVAFAIDNSGSMFSIDYLKNIEGLEVDESTPEAYGNDIDFKRLSLMKTIVNLLPDYYLFSVGAFQGSYHTVTRMNSDKVLVNDSIEKLKTDYQDFDGTSVENAFSDGIREFSRDTYNRKFLILLSDGRSTNGLFTFHSSVDYSLERAKENDIQVITIGLGNVDDELLKRIADETSGVYIHVADSDILTKLVERLLVFVGKLRIDSDQNGEDDREIIADSGFRSDIDGFPFENFLTVQSQGGNCFGIAFTTILIYERVLPKAMEAYVLKPSLIVDPANTRIEAYELSEKSIERLKGKTYDIDVPTIFAINGDYPEDYRYFKDTLFLIADEYRNKLRTLGFDFTLKELNRETHGQFCTEAEIEMIDPFSKKADKNIPSEELDFIKVISRNHKIQFEDKMSKKLESVFKESFVSVQNNFLNPCIDELMAGRPILSVLNGTVGGHAVVTTKIAYDLNDPTVFYLTFYDSNMPGLDMTGEFKLTKILINNEIIDGYKFEYGYGAISSVAYTDIELFPIQYYNGDELIYSTNY